MRGEDAAGALGLGEVGDQGTAVAARHALIAEASVGPAALDGGTDGHTEALRTGVSSGQNISMRKENSRAGMP